MRGNLQVACSLLILLLLLFVSTAKSADVEGSLAEATSHLSQCALPCFVGGIKLSTCASSNTTCICNDIIVASSFVKCLRSACGMSEQLETIKISKHACNQGSRDYTAQSRQLNWAMLGLCTPFAMSRLLSKVELSPGAFGCAWLPSMPDAGWDDLCLFLAWVCTLVLGVIIGVPLERAALGRDLWTLSKQQIVDTRYWIYVSSPVYFTSLALLKASFIFFYLRIFGFPGSVARFFGLCDLRLLLIGTLWVNVLSGVVIVCLSIGQCSPISLVWTQWVEPLSAGSCLDIGRLLWAQAMTNVVMGFWVLILPLSQIAKLHRSFATKLGVGAMFSLGIITTIVSIIRARILSVVGTGDTPGLMMSVSASWSMVESSVGIVCACLPGLRMFVLFTLPRAWIWAGRSLGSRSSDITALTNLQHRQQQQQHRCQFQGTRRLWTPSGSLLQPTIMSTCEGGEDGPYSRFSEGETTMTTVRTKGDIESYAMADVRREQRLSQNIAVASVVSCDDGQDGKRPRSVDLGAMLRRCP